MKGVALLGPTSSGKTGLSLELAARLRAQGRRPVVLNADSRQVYRYMDIGTSKIARRDMQGIEHRLLDIVEPTHPLPLERYAAEARRALDDLIVDPDALPIVVGGTGTYVRGDRRRLEPAPAPRRRVAISSASSREARSARRTAC